MDKERGQATVEFALSITVFLLLLFALFDVGRLIYLQNALTAASQEAARILVAHPSTSPSRLRAEITRRVVGFDPSDIDVYVRWPTPSLVEVEVAHTYHSVVPIPFFNRIRLRARTRMHVSLGP